jgi:predicted acyltransferase
MKHIEQVIEQPQETTSSERLETPIRPSPSSPPSPPRLMSMDAYRGLVMFLMMAEILHLSRVYAAHPGNVFWKVLAWNQTHVEWFGCSLHDLIQPSFSFLVGVALPYSIASRIAKGQSHSKMFRHAAWRSLVLILLGVFLRSVDRTQTYWTFEDTLSQIGMGYLILFMLGFRSPRVQWISLGLILIGYWAAFVLYPLPPPDFDYSKVGVPVDWPFHSAGIAAHFNKNSNLAWAFDTWFLNLFPREAPFSHNGGGYATLSFIPTLGTMILGLIAGRWLRSESTKKETLRRLLVAGMIGISIGLVLHFTGICPLVKRIWTPTWTIFSGGCCFLLLALFYWLIDMNGWRRWAFPLVVIGMNSIAIYVLVHLIDRFIIESFKTHFGQNVFKVLGEGNQTLLSGGVALLVFWLILYWMYRRKIFIRI